jgi:hypothetical protein
MSEGPKVGLYAGYCNTFPPIPLEPLLSHASLLYICPTFQSCCHFNLYVTCAYTDFAIQTSIHIPQQLLVKCFHMWTCTCAQPPYSLFLNNPQSHILLVTSFHFMMQQWPLCSTIILKFCSPFLSLAWPHSSCLRFSLWWRCQCWSSGL